MPPLTRWFIKSSLLCLVLALTLRVLQTGEYPDQIAPMISALSPVYFHLFMVGWVTQAIFGVVFWMFPKYSLSAPRGSERLGWISFWLLNVGLSLRIVAEPMNALQSGWLWSALLVSSGLAQWLAGLAFVANSWSRVKEK